MPPITKKIPVEVQNRSGFNCSHSNSFTAKCGTLVPILCDHVMPNTTINLDVACEVNLPPAISDFYGTIEARMEFFFVPYRVIWAGWKYFFVQPPQGGAGNIPSNNPTAIRITDVPGFTFGTSVASRIDRGSLFDMLGNKTNMNATGDISMPNILPFVAYHKIYDDFYRDSRITQPLFTPITSSSDVSTPKWHNLPWILGDDLNTGTKQYFSVGSGRYHLLDYHQRCWDKDYFTNATYAPQAGDASSIEMEFLGTPTGGGDGTVNGTVGFTISQLRVANSLQRFAEVNNIAGQRMADQQYARFGCYPSDSALDRPMYLGQKRFGVYKRSVYQQTENTANPNTNPFSGVLGNKTTALSGYGEGFLGKFHAKDAGLIMVIFSLVPKATYSSGTRRYLMYSKLSDFPEPLLQGTGDQPIYISELVNTFYGGSYSNGTFGYTQRYSEAKFMSDEVHGLLADGQSLDMFQLQRSFNDSTDAELSTDFLEIPTDYLDQVFTADANVSQYGCWCNCFLDYKKVQPLAAYSLPTLGDPKDTHTVIVDAGGKRL